MKKIIYFYHILWAENAGLNLVDYQLQIESSKKTKTKLSVNKVPFPKDDFSQV